MCIWILEAADVDGDLDKHPPAVVLQATSELNCLEGVEHKEFKQDAGWCMFIAVDSKDPIFLKVAILSCFAMK